MSFNHIPGQQRAKRMLLGGLSSGKVSHAYIFQGPPGTGKKEAAHAFAKALLCPNGREGACGECLSCRKADSGNHTGIVQIQPDGASVKIDQLRELQRGFAYRNTSGSERQVYIVHQADAMTPQAANSLLKFLEEPGSPVVAILIAVNGQALLPTIRSRAQTIPFVPLAPDEMERTLIEEGLSAPLVRAAVRLTAGLDAARELSQLNWFAEIRNVMIQLAKECSGGAETAMLTAQRKLVKSELSDHIDTLFDLFLLWFKDMIHIQLGNREKLVFADQADFLAAQSFKRGIGGWTDCMKSAMEARRRLAAHANAQLAIDRFLLTLADAG